MAAGVFEGLGTVVVRVRDVEAAADWYREKLELASGPSGVDGSVVLELGGATTLTLRALTGVDVPMTPGAATTYPVFVVDDVERAWNTLRDRGVLVDPVVDGGVARWFEFRDLDGNRLDVRQVTRGA